MPAVSTNGLDPGISDFNILMPRVGVTYALGEERKTLLRGSFARFAEQYLTVNHGRLSATGGSYLIYGYFNDFNNNGFMDGANEAATYRDPFPLNFDPTSTSPVSPNVTDTDLKPAVTDELTFAVEHALTSDFVISGQALYRKVSDITETRQFVRDASSNKRQLVPGDYIQGTCTTAAVGPVECWSRRPGVTLAGGSYLTNGDREQEALGLTAGFTKRLSNQWMARGNFTYTDWTWNVPNSYYDHVDPNNFGDGAGTTASGDRDGETVAERSGGSGSKGGIWLSTEWSGNVSGLYQVAPEAAWGFNIGGAFNFRQGYPNPPWVSVRPADGSTRSLQFLSEIDSRRNDDVYTLDLRLDKTFALGPVDATVGLDVFNVFNNNEVIQRGRQASTAATSNYNYITETISPRVLRAGLTLVFQ
jgi:hypothetical protein